MKKCKQIVSITYKDNMLFWEIVSSYFANINTPSPLVKLCCLQQKSFRERTGNSRKLSQLIHIYYLGHVYCTYWPIHLIKDKLRKMNEIVKRIQKFLIWKAYFMKSTIYQLERSRWLLWDDTQSSAGKIPFKSLQCENLFSFDI